MNHSRFTKLALLLIAVGALVLAGCGSDGSTGPKGDPGTAPSAEDVAEALLADSDAVDALKGEPGEAGEDADPAEVEVPDADAIAMDVKQTLLDEAIMAEFKSRLGLDKVTPDKPTLMQVLDAATAIFRQAFMIDGPLTVSESADLNTIRTSLNTLLGTQPTAETIEAAFQTVYAIYFPALTDSLLSKATTGYFSMVGPTQTVSMSEVSRAVTAAKMQLTTRLSATGVLLTSMSVETAISAVANLMFGTATSVAKDRFELLANDAAEGVLTGDMPTVKKVVDAVGAVASTSLAAAQRVNATAAMMAYNRLMGTTTTTATPMCPAGQTGTPPNCVTPGAARAARTPRPCSLRLPGTLTPGLAVRPRGCRLTSATTIPTCWRVSRCRRPTALTFSKAPR